MVKPAFNGVNDSEIILYIRSQGYGFASVPGYRVALTRAVGAVRKYDGLRRAEVIGGVGQTQYEDIKSRASSAAEAGAKIIKVVLGASIGEEVPLAEQVQQEAKRREELKLMADKEVALRLRELGIGEKEIAALKAGGTVKRKPGRPRKENVGPTA